MRKFKLGIYPITLHIGTFCDFSKLKENYNFDIDESLIDSSNGITIPMISKANLNGNHCAVLFDTTKPIDEVIVHEAVHVAFFIYKNCSCEINQDMDEEPFVYLVEYIYNILKNDQSNG